MSGKGFEKIHTQVGRPVVECFSSGGGGGAVLKELLRTETGGEFNSRASKIQR